MTGDAEGWVVHGRDNSLKVWQIRPTDEQSLSTYLPTESIETSRKEPWLLHSLSVNTLNFCAFAMCHQQLPDPSTHENPVLIAVPGTKEAQIDIFQLPSEFHHSRISPPQPGTGTGGMVMCLAISYINSHLLVASGYENGQLRIHSQDASDSSSWTLIQTATPHTQPLLSLSISPSLGHIYTSGADGIISRHLISPTLTTFPQKVAATTETLASEPKILQTKHSGQQSLTLRSDGKIFATAGWDARIRVYSTKTMRELAVLKWHKEGCYAVAFAEILAIKNPQEADGRQLGLSSAENDSHRNVEAEGSEHHSAHKVSANGQQLERARSSQPVAAPKLNTPSTSMATLQRQREDKVQNTHWLAAGSKDGKVSLWEIY
ncbi:hypothetical protein LTS18_003482 [Coniosporium uncinatum]|uniref:Uncharacterized protein n=1 Tax=Coniosporium uncinatum TaxID=93489 RepID=A0ACC3D6R6_9PEZI|nr:hypothetical protein LTS18_003482 [Coniosporium uncinatum]